MRGLGDLGIFFRTKDHLGEAFAIAQIDKDHSAVIAAGVHPAGQRDLFADVGGAKGVAMMSAIHGGEPSVWAMVGISQVGRSCLER